MLYVYHKFEFHKYQKTILKLPSSTRKTNYFGVNFLAKCNNSFLKNITHRNFFSRKNSLAIQ